jgi:hypothetical protein
LGSCESRIVSEDTEELAETQESICTSVCTRGGKNVHGDDRLATVVQAWPDLPEALQRAVLAIVESERVRAEP